MSTVFTSDQGKSSLIPDPRSLTPVEVSSYQECCIALARAGKNAITLKNKRGMHAYAGFLFVKTMFEKATERYPLAKVSIIFDADNDPIAATAALKYGYKKIIFSGSAEYRVKLESMAKQFKAEILT